MTPLVSILIPAYNAGAWIRDTIESALQQTWQRKEVVIVDDGSSDETLAIAKSYASANVIVVTQPNQGAAATRNRAYSICQGDYVQWLDADDLLCQTKIDLQMKALNRGRGKRTLLSGPHGTFYYRRKSASFVPSPLWHDLSPQEWLIRKMSKSCHLQTATWLVSREISEAAGPWDTRLLGDDDGEYFCRVLLASDSIVFVPSARVYYRSVGDNRLSYIGKSDKKLEAQFMSMRLHIGYLRSLEDSERTRRACITYLQKYMFDFCPERPDIVAEMEHLARELGGKLEPPQSLRKYAWIQRLFGWPAAKRAHFFFPRVKHSAIKAWDRAMVRFDRGTA